MNDEQIVPDWSKCPWTIQEAQSNAWQNLAETMLAMAKEHQMEALSVEMVRKGDRTQWRVSSMWQDGKGRVEYGDSPYEALLPATFHPDFKRPPHLYLVEDAPHV